MKKFLFTLCTLALAAMPLWAQDIAIDDDSLYTEGDVSEFPRFLGSTIGNSRGSLLVPFQRHKIGRLPSKIAAYIEAFIIFVLRR